MPRKYKNIICSRALEAPIRHEYESEDGARLSAERINLTLKEPLKDVIRARAEGKILHVESSLPSMTPNEAYKFIWGEEPPSL